MSTASNLQAESLSFQHDLLENNTNDLDFWSSFSWPENQQKQAPPPLPFSTAPKLQPIEKVLNDHPGNDVAKLRELAIALARDAIFGKDELIQCSLSGRKNTGSLNKKKLDYII